MHQKIRPQTKTPTASAATTEPIHRSYICVALRRDAALGQPKPRTRRPTEQDWQTPARPSPSDRSAAPPADRPRRRAVRPAAVPPNSLRPPGPASSSSAAGAGFRAPTAKASPTVADYSTMPALDRLGVGVSAAHSCDAPAGRYRRERWPTRSTSTGPALPRRGDRGAACIRSRGRRCWPRSTTAGPTRASSTRRPGGPGLLLDAAREAVARRAGVRAEEVPSPPAAPTAVHGAVPAGWRGGAGSGRRWSIRRSSTGRSCTRRERHVGGGRDRGRVPVDRLGAAGPGRVFGPQAFGPGVALAALITASHEVGTVQPVAEAAGGLRRGRGAAVRRRGPVASAGCPLPAGWSVLTGERPQVGRPGRRGGAGGPQGTAGSPGRPTSGRLAPPGGEPAGGRGGGGEPAGRGAPTPRPRRRGCDAWWTGSAARVAATVPDVEVVGDPVHRLPHLVTFSCLYVDGEALLHALDRRGFAVSSGSSCTAVHAAARRTCWRRWGCSRTATSGSACTGRRRGGRGAVPGRAAGDRAELRATAGVMGL